VSATALLQNAAIAIHNLNSATLAPTLVFPGMGLACTTAAGSTRAESSGYDARLPAAPRGHPMPPPSSIGPRHPIRVVLSSTALLPFMSIRRAAALAIAQLGVAAFFIPGVSRSALGDSAGWFVLAVAVLAGLIRAIDIESWARLIPGGFISRVRQAFGPGATRVAAAAALVDRLLLGALACVLIGHYAAGVSVIAIAGRRFTGYVRPEDLATLIAVAAIGLLWIRARIGHDIGREAMARSIWIGIGILALTMVWGLATLAGGSAAPLTTLGSPPAPIVVTGWPGVDAALIYVVGVALTCRRLVVVKCWRVPRMKGSRRAFRR
jgi:hypothetical protein